MLSPDVFCDTLKFVLANCGIALVFLPHLDGSFLHGATFVDSNRIVMGLTVRGKDADKFWFSLFHEIGHILSGHIWDFHGLGDEHEKEADAFAQEALIPQKAFDEFVDKGVFSRSSIFLFSQKINIAQGIIVGRLQKEGFLKYSWFNDLKERYEISD